MGDESSVGLDVEVQLGRYRRSIVLFNVALIEAGKCIEGIGTVPYG